GTIGIAARRSATGPRSQRPRKHHGARPNPIAPELPQPLRAGTSRAPIRFRLRRPGNLPTDSDSTFTRPERYEEISLCASVYFAPPLRAFLLPRFVRRLRRLPDRGR